MIVSTQSSSPGSTGPTAAQLYAQEAAYGTFGAYALGGDPDELDRSGENVDDIVTFLGGDRYKLTVQNVGFLGYINSFSWRAPNMVITGITSSGSGSCTFSNAKSVETQWGHLPEGIVSCQGFTIPPPKCSCRGGGTATISFDAHNLATSTTIHYGVAESRIELGNMTLVPYHIPSYLGAANNTADLPLCAKGQQNSKAHPCVHTS